MRIEINNDLIQRVKALSCTHLLESENINTIIEEIIEDWLDQVYKNLIKIDFSEEKH